VLARERAREKATHDGSDVVHGYVVTTPDLMGCITLLGAVLVHNDELGGRCGCSKRNQPRRHFDCGASSTVSHASGSGFSFSDRNEEDQIRTINPTQPRERRATSRKNDFAKQVTETGNSQTRLFPLQFVVRPSRDAETAKSPPLHAGSAHEQSRAEVPTCRQNMCPVHAAFRTRWHAQRSQARCQAAELL
jgi:hypothetical protein